MSLLSRLRDLFRPKKKFVIKSNTKDIWQEGYPITEVILHTSATSSTWHIGKTVEEMRDEIREWHLDNGWRDIGYHYVVAPDGSVAMGRALNVRGAHVGGHNNGTVGICMIPVNDHNGITRFEDYFTEEQRESVVGLVSAIGEVTRLSKVTGHNDYANKECPGFKVESSRWM